MAIGAAFAFLAESVNKLSPLFVVHLAQKNLGTDGFGFARFAINIVEVAAPLVAFGYWTSGTIAIGRQQKDPASVAALIGDMTGLRLLHAILAIGTITLCTSMLPELSPYSGLVVPLSLFLLASAFDCLFVLAGTQRMALANGLTVAAKTTSLMAVVAFVREETDVATYASLTMGANAIISLGSFGFVVWRHSLTWPRWPRMKKLFVGAIPFAATFILLMLAERADIFLVEHLMGPKGVGLYSGPALLIQSLMPVVWSITALFFSEAVARTDEKSSASSADSQYSTKQHFSAAMLAMLAVVTPVVVACFLAGGRILALVFDQSFLPMGSTLALLSIGLLCHATLAVCGMQVLVLRGRAHLMNWSLVAAIATTLAVGYLGFNFFGDYRGIAIGPLAGKAISAALCLWFARETVRSLAMIVVGSIGLAGVVMAISLHLSATLPLLPMLAIGTCTYVLVLGILQKNFVLRIIRAIRRPPQI